MFHLVPGWETILLMMSSISDFLRRRKSVSSLKPSSIMTFCNTSMVNPDSLSRYPTVGIPITGAAASVFFCYKLLCKALRNINTLMDVKGGTNIALFL